MNNQAKPQGISINNPKGNKSKLVSSAIQNKGFIDPGVNMELRFFKLGRTEEEILIDIMGNISFKIS